MSSKLKHVVTFLKITIYTCALNKLIVTLPGLNNTVDPEKNSKVVYFGHFFIPSNERVVR